MDRVKTFAKYAIWLILFWVLSDILIYYGIKNIIIYTCERKKELDNLSDIKEIVKDEPIKKETKRNR